MIRLTLTGWKAEDSRIYYLKSNLLAAFFALLASHLPKYSTMTIEFGLTPEMIQAEIFQENIV